MWRKWKGEGESSVCGGSAGVKGRAVYVEEVEGEGESSVCGGSAGVKGRGMYENRV